MRPHHVVDGKPRFVNALAQETSPYLLQHAHNPVDWMPWGRAAFERARSEDKPLLVSVGYSTCHWCHVMEQESFEDEEIARAMNDAFVCVKVDREERPDVDALTMLAVQAMTGSGGWPSTVFMTADQQPFFAGTYFPARDGDRGARMGFLSILKRLSEAWTSERARVLESSSAIAADLTAACRPLHALEVPLGVVDQAVLHVGARYDERWGGLAPAPKFPSSLPIRVLLRHHARTGNPESLARAHQTFLRMSAGGIYDQVGGGLHRYATDERWLVPHFEKMLYDNALLVIAGIELWQVTRDPEVERVVRDVLEYVARDMTSPEGAFFSATDADSVGPAGASVEGWFFTWTPAEARAVLERALGDDACARVLAAWDISERGNFEGRSIPWRRAPVDEDTRGLLEQARAPLLAARNRRPRPPLDDKIIAAWNGLMISAFARAARAFVEPDFAERARRALRCLRTTMIGPDGRVARTMRGGVPRHLGMLDDHANLCAAAIDVFEATADHGALKLARALADIIETVFADTEHGGYFTAPRDGLAVLWRHKETHDGSEPAGASVHALNLVRLSALLGDHHLRARAVRTVASVGQVLTRQPLALPEMLLAVEALHADLKEIVLVARGDGGALARALGGKFLPHAVFVPKQEGALPAVPLAEGRVAVGGAATVYICANGACGLPVTVPDQLDGALAV